MPEKINSNIFEKLRKYHFELRHVMVIFIILATVQLLISIVQKYSIQDFLEEAQKSYQEDTAERLANLTTTSLEMILETAPELIDDEQTSQKITEAINIILSQQLLLRHVQDVLVIVSCNGTDYAIDSGKTLYEYFFKGHCMTNGIEAPNQNVLHIFENLKSKIIDTEEIQSILEGKQTFHVFVPLVPKGEIAGSVYMKISPDFTFITREILTSYNITNLIFSGLILFGLLAMFYISSYTLRERDTANQLLFTERENQLKERINFQKEALFTKRIYYTHHKAEKVMGFIKQDLKQITASNIEEIKYRLTRYANFISRVIYDMKWFDPPIQVIRNPMFKTDLNDVIEFLIKNICLRNASNASSYKFVMNLDKSLPIVNINEFVVWEILEPLFQNSMDHNENNDITITVTTKYSQKKNESKIFIADDGLGISQNLLQENEDGRKNIFMEDVSTKDIRSNSGYGCYLAYEIAKERCGWDLDAENVEGGGCRFILTIPHNPNGKRNDKESQRDRSPVN